MCGVAAPKSCPICEKHTQVRAHTCNAALCCGGGPSVERWGVVRSCAGSSPRSAERWEYPRLRRPPRRSLPLDMSKGVPAPTPQPAQIPWPASYYSSSFSCCKCCSSCDDYCYCYYSYLAPIQAKPRHANYLLYHFYFDVARPEPQCCSVPAIRLPIRRCISYTVIDTYLNS